MAQPNGPSVGASSWALAIVGIAAIAFGVLTVIWPHITLLVIVLLFGGLALATGIVSIFEMFRAMGEHRTWWTHLLSTWP
jgi:uncharacterized membrane protein HdeD (DUF308 family)